MYVIINEQLVSYSAGDETPARAFKRGLRCGVCRIQKDIASLTEQCTTATADTDLEKIRLTLKQLQQRAQEEITKLRGQLSEVKQLVHKTCPPKCAFALMRMASMQQGNKKEKSKKPEGIAEATIAVGERGKSIAAALRAKKDESNEQLLRQIVQGTITLVSPATCASGRDARPSAISERHTASRRLKMATRGFLDAAQGDGQVLVWIIRRLYQIDGIRQAFDVALLDNLRTV